MRRLRERRWTIPAVFVLLIGLIVGIAIARSGPTVTEFRTARAALGTVTQTVDITGTLQPSSETDLDFGSNGHVQTIAVQAGQTVAAGSVLASLDPTDAQTQLKNAQIALQSAQAKLAQDAPGSTNVQQQIAESQVNNARSLIGGARNGVIDAQQLGQQTVAGSQIALQTALAAAQGLITQDQQAVVALQAQLNDTTRTDQQAISVAAASLRQIQAQVQGTISVDQANLATAQRILSAQQQIDQAAINAAQATVNFQQNVVNQDQSNPTTDTAQDNNEAAACSTPPPSSQPTPACTNAQYADESADASEIPNQQAQLQHDQAQLQIDQANLQGAQAKAQQDIVQAQGVVAADQATLTAARNEGNAAIQQAQATLAQAQANAQRDVDIAQGNLNNGLVQLQNAKVSFASTQQTNTNAMSQEQIRANQAVHVAQSQLDQASSSLQGLLAQLSALQNGQIPQQVVQDAAQVTADQQAVTAAENTVAGTTLVAPVAGLIEQVNIAQGQAIGGGNANATGTGTGAGALAASAASGGPTAFNNAAQNVTHAIVLITPTAFQVSGPVSDAQLPQVRPADAVYVVPAGGGNQLQGHVVGVAPAALTASGVATFTVTAVVDTVSSSIHPGSTAQMSIVVQREVDVLTVPSSSVHTVGASSYVLVPRNGQSVTVPVTIGASDPQRTQITSGLHLGDVVVLAEIGVKPPSGAAPSGGGAAGGGGAGGGGGGNRAGGGGARTG